jgi:hypothetical protein
MSIIDTEITADTTTGPPLSIDRIVANAKQMASQSGGGYSAGQLTLGNVLRVMAEHGLVKLSTGQIVQAMNECRDIQNDSLVSAAQLLAYNYRRVDNLSYAGIIRFVRQATVLGPAGIAALHLKLRRPKLLDLRVRAKMRANAARQIDGRRLAQALYKLRHRFSGWERDFIEAAAAFPDEKYISKDQYNQLVALAEIAGVDLEALEGTAGEPRRRSTQRGSNV